MLLIRSRCSLQKRRNTRSLLILFLLTKYIFFLPGLLKIYSTETKQFSVCYIKILRVFIHNQRPKKSNLYKMPHSSFAERTQLTFISIKPDACEKQKQRPLPRTLFIANHRKHCRSKLIIYNSAPSQVRATKPERGKQLRTFSKMCQCLKIFSDINH